jgi:hypothetical protein
LTINNNNDNDDDDDNNNNNNNNNNQRLFTRNMEVQIKGTRNNINPFLPTISLTKVQKGAYCSGIKTYNHLSKKLKTVIQ